MSTTGPTTWTILPLFIFTPDFVPPSRSIVAGLAASNFEEFLGNIALAQLVVFERQVLDQCSGIVRSVRHCHHPGALLACLSFQQSSENENVEVVPKKIRKHCLCTGFKYYVSRIGG